MKNQGNHVTSSKQPIHQIRHGAVSASIWQQETEKGTLFNVTFQRSYLEGDTWKHSSSFGARNLLFVGIRLNWSPTVILPFPSLPKGWPFGIRNTRWLDDAIPVRVRGYPGKVT